MTEKTVKIPGPDHPITIEPASKRVVVRSGDKVIADTVHALFLREAKYPAVQYIPRNDVDMSALVRCNADVDPGGGDGELIYACLHRFIVDRPAITVTIGEAFAAASTLQL